MHSISKASLNQLLYPREHKMTIRETLTEIIIMAQKVDKFQNNTRTTEYFKYKATNQR